MRLPPIDRDNLDDARRRILDAIESGPRGQGRPGMGTIGPFGVYVRAPSFGNEVQSLGAALRFNTAIAENLKEVAICTVGAHHRARFEFAAHARLAAAAGVSVDAIERLRTGQDPRLAGDEAIAHDVARQLLENHRIDEPTFQAALRAFGETGLIELVGVIGYYCLVSHTLNAFDIPLADGMDDPFPGE